MSQKKMDGSNSTAKRKGNVKGSGSARSKAAQSRIPGKLHTTVGKSVTLSEVGSRIKKAKTLHELALLMYFVRDAGTTVKVFDFEADAKFYDLIQKGQFKKAHKIAQDRFSAVAKAKATIVPFEKQLGVRKAYSAALHKHLLTKKISPTVRKLIMLQLRHFLKPTKIVKTPFDSEAHADTPFDSEAKPAKMKGSKRRF